MGLTLLRKGTRPPRKNPTAALVLAGGAVSGGAFKVGGLKALDDYLVGRRMVDFDMYIGLSAGSMLAVPLAGGISPDEMVKVLEGTSGRFDQLTPAHFYRPNLREFWERPQAFLWDVLTYAPSVLVDFVRELPDLRGVLGPSLRAFVRSPSYTAAEDVAMRILEHATPSRPAPDLTEHVPTGLFENSGLERWLRQNLEKTGMPNDFAAFERERGRRLYVAACELDTARRVVFGADDRAHVSISQAVQASTALPLFYKPARIGGVDYIDGGIRNTANIDVAIDKGADLVVCYNPFAPFMNRLDDTGEFVAGHSLADRGLMMVVNQVFRTLLHSRLRIALGRYMADEDFHGDIVLLEPHEADADYFGINPLAFWRRADAIREGFGSVRQSIEERHADLAEVLARYGFHLDRRTALRRSAKLRRERGYRVTRREGSPGAPDLRLVDAAS